MLSILAALGQVALAAASAVVTIIAGLQAGAAPLGGRAGGKELRAGLKRLLISVVLLPILPDGGYGQYGGLLSVWCLTTSV